MGESFIRYQPLCLLSSFFSGISDFSSILIQKMIMDEDNDDKDEAHPAWIQWFIFAVLSSPIT